MPNLLWKVITGLLLICPQWVFAQTGLDLSGDAADIFQLSPTDPTKNFLGQIFGTVGTVLHGTSGQLLGQMFKIFNIGILVVAGMFFVWSVTQTIVSTAHEGQFMGGGKSKPAFTILRTVGGFGLLMPNFSTGYSMIQALVMWVILQGVGFANTAWNAALDYFQDGGVVLATPSQGTSKLVDLAGAVLAAQVCMYNAEAEEKKKQGTAAAGTPEGEYFPAYRPKWGQTFVDFPKDRGNANAGCGRFTWNQGGDKNAYVQAAMQQVTIDTQTAAQKIVEPGGYEADDIKRLTMDGVVGAAADFTNITLPVRRQGAGANAAINNFFAQERLNGWIYAGAYYFKLTAIQGTFSDAATIKINLASNIHGLTLCAGSGCLMPTFTDQNSLTVNTQEAGPLLSVKYKTLSGNVAAGRQLAMQIDYTANGIPQVEGIEAGALTPVMAPMTEAIQTAITSAGSGTQGTAKDPILELKAAGEAMVAAAATVLLIGTIVITIISAIASLMSSINSAGYAIRDMLSFIIAFLTPLLVMILTQGMILATYIPLIPFIIWMFAVIGWFIIVIETLVAAPLVALGLTHPEGHDLMGASQQALMLLLNVFLRPILMVIGLFAGMILSKIGLQFVGKGMAVLLSGGAVNGFLVLALLFVYIALIIQMLQTCYSLITHVPDRVMRWVGVNDPGSGGAGEQALQAGKGAAQQYAQSRADTQTGLAAKGGSAFDKSAAPPGGGDGGGSGGKELSASGESPGGGGKGGGGGGGGGGQKRDSKKLGGGLKAWKGAGKKSGGGGGPKGGGGGGGGGGK